MYNCNLCNRTIGPRVPLAMVVIKKRILTKGWETVKEIGVCPACKGSLTAARAANGKK